MRKFFVLTLITLLMNCSFVRADDVCYMEYKEPEISYNMVKAGVKVSLPQGEITDTVFCNGRLGVPLVNGVKAMGGVLESGINSYKITVGDKTVSLSSAVTSNRPVIFSYNNNEYISLYELITPFDYEIIPNIDSNEAEVLKEVCSNNEDVYKKADNFSKEAYIRFEDITADGLKPGGGGNYTVDMLEKLKYTAEYMYDRGQEYYIAWIPVYAYPQGDYWNDVSVDFNLYNSYFLYVLDYMTDHNGHLGLHGYTHQYGMEESAVGYEWGKNTPYNTNEQQRRMIAAKETCRKLGYKDEFFEFPHYGATKEQMLMAEYYFDAVYQAYPTDELANYITYTNKWGKKIYYIPTPADYVHYIRDISIFERIKNSVDNGYTLSLFFHPVIDEKQFSVKTEGNERIWNYSEEGTLSGIVNYIIDLGYSFSDFR